MKFTKMHGAGNDFVIINLIEEKLDPACAPELAQKLCARRTGIGADGLMLTARAEKGGDFKLLFYNLATPGYRTPLSSWTIGTRSRTTSFLVSAKSSASPLPFPRVRM